MRRRDRKGSDYSQYETVTPPAPGTRVTLADGRQGVVTDRGVSTVEVRLDDGPTVRVAADKISVV